MELLLFLSMFIYVLYIFSLNFVNFKVREKAVRDGSVPVKYFKTHQDTSVVPETVLLHTRHHDNQYQAPLVFLVTGSLTLVMNEVSLYSVIFAWCFIFSRFIHSFFLLKNKNILNRAKAFLAGWVFILLLWFCLFFSFL